MRLRKSTRAPERYRDEQVYNRQPARGPTAPAFPEKLKQATVPFNPDLPVAPWISKSLRDSAANRPGIDHDVDRPTTAPEATTSNDGDQRSALVDRQEKNNMISDTMCLTNHDVTAAPGNLVLGSQSDADLEDVASQSVENVSWSSLSLAMQVHIYTQLKNHEGALKAAELLTLSEQELDHAESHWRFRQIYPVDEDQLREDWMKDMMDMQLRQAASSMSRSDQARAAKELDDKYLQHMVQHYHYAYASEHEIDKALLFLQQHGLSLSLGGSWKDEDENSSVPLYPVLTLSAYENAVTRPSNTEPGPSDTHSEAQHPTVAAVAKRRLPRLKDASTSITGSQPQPPRPDTTSHHPGVADVSLRGGKGLLGQSNARVTSKINNKLSVLSVTPSEELGGQILSTWKRPVKLKVKAGGQAVLRKDKSRNRRVTAQVADNATSHAEFVSAPPVRDPQTRRLVHPRRLVVQDGKLVELPDEPDAFITSMYQLGLNARSHYLRRGPQDRLRHGQDPSQTAQTHEDDFNQRLLSVTAGSLPARTVVEKSPDFGREHHPARPSSPCAPPWSPITERAESVSPNASRRASTYSPQTFQASTHWDDDLFRLPDPMAQDLQARATLGVKDVTQREPDRSILEDSRDKAHLSNTLRLETTVDVAPSATDCPHKKITDDVLRSKEIHQGSQEILPKKSSQQKANMHIDSGIGTSRANSTEDEMLQETLQDKTEPRDVRSHYNTTAPSRPGCPATGHSTIYSAQPDSLTVAATLNAVSEKLRTSPAKATTPPSTTKKDSTGVIIVDANKIAFSPTMPTTSVEKSSTSTPAGAATPSQATKPRAKRGPYRKTRERMQKQQEEEAAAAIITTSAVKTRQAQKREEQEREAPARTTRSKKMKA